MVKVLYQQRDHPLYPLLQKFVPTTPGLRVSTARRSPRKPRGEPRAILTKLGNQIFQHCVKKWNALPDEAKQWYNEHAPPQFCTGFLWYTWSCLIKNYNAGPWTVAVSPVGGHRYIRPAGTEREIFSKGYIDATEIGSLARIEWEPGCPEEHLPIFLVHGWYPEAFDPADVWRTMTLTLTGKDPTKAGNYILVYDPEHPNDPRYAVRCIDGQGYTVYISNYTHNPAEGTPDDIRQYAQSLAREIELIKNHRGAPAVDIVAHSMGALVARAYIENEDLEDNPWPAPYQDDVRMLVMLAPPNRGTYFANLYPGWWDWTSVQQMEHGSDFLTQLNAGVTGKSKGVEYHIVASNRYDCLAMEIAAPQYFLQILLLGVPRTEPYTSFPYHATRLCEVSQDKPNDGEIVFEDTFLFEQDGQPEVDPENFWVQDFDHWEMRGRVLEPCAAATIVLLIVNKYDLTKWRAKGKDISPPQLNWVHRAFFRIKKSKTVYDIYDYIVQHNIDLLIEEGPPGFVARFDDLRHAIILSPTLQSKSDKVVAQYIVHEGEHARWYPVNSIYQEYNAWKAEADFWNEVKGQEQDDVCDLVAGVIAQGREYAMNYISTLPPYQHLPRYALIAPALWDACDLLDSIPEGNAALLMVQRKGVEISFGDVPHRAYVWYDETTRQGTIDHEWASLPAPALAAAIAYMGARASWDCPDSINQEYHAYHFMTGVWIKLKGKLWLDYFHLLEIIDQGGKGEWFCWLWTHEAYRNLVDYYP